MQTLNCEQDFRSIDSCPWFFEFAFKLENLGQVTSFAILHDKVKLMLCLESIMQIHDERMLGIAKHIPLGLCVSD